MGLALKNINKPEEAIRSYNRAINLDPKNSEAHYNLGNALH